MIFKKEKIYKSINLISGHNIKLPEKTIRKSNKITKEDIFFLKKNRIEEIYVAILDKNDIHEDIAAGKIVKNIIGKNVYFKKAQNGRADFYSKINGLLNFSTINLTKINSSFDDLAVCSLKKYSVIKKNQLLGNVKILPYAITKAKLNKILKIKQFKNLFEINPVTIKKVDLVITQQLFENNKNMNKIKQSLTERLKSFGLKIGHSKIINHDVSDLVSYLKTKAISNTDLLLIYGSTSIADTNDVIPFGIRKAKGNIIAAGIPSDPGNLMLIAKLNNTIILGVPGCAKSLQKNGFDLILEQICHGIEISKKSVAEISNGGLHKNLISK